MAHFNVSFMSHHQSMLPLRLHLSEAWDVVLLYLIAFRAAPLDIAIVLPDGFSAVVAWADFVIGKIHPSPSK